MDGVAGTSVGAITATLLAVGYSGAELTEVLENLPLESFLDFDEQLHGILGLTLPLMPLSIVPQRNGPVEHAVLYPRCTLFWAF